MSHVPHELAEKFPADKDKMQILKQTDAHFAKLSDEYHELNREIHRVETGVTPADDSFEKQLRRKRLVLKDEIGTFLR
jgi:uncharacterized protein YdcH (DUF465 family)